MKYHTTIFPFFMALTLQKDVDYLCLPSEKLCKEVCESDKDIKSFGDLFEEHCRATNQYGFDFVGQRRNMITTEMHSLGRLKDPEFTAEMFVMLSSCCDKHITNDLISGERSMINILAHMPVYQDDEFYQRVIEFMDRNQTSNHYSEALRMMRHFKEKIDKFSRQ